MSDDEYYETLELVMMNHWMKKAGMNEAFAKEIVKWVIEDMKKEEKEKEEEEKEKEEEEEE